MNLETVIVKDGLLGLNFFDKTTLKIELDLPKANIELIENKVVTHTPTANDINP